MPGWIKQWRHRQKLMRHSLRNGRIHRLLGDRMFSPHVWGFDERSFAGGLALGLFIAFTPTIPFQMLLCAIGAILFRVNLFAAVAAIWLTNPVTAVPVYLAASRVGHALCDATGIGESTSVIFGFEGRVGKFMQEGLYLWTGCLVFSLVSSCAGYLAVRSAWKLNARLKKTAAKTDE